MVLEVHDLHIGQRFSFSENGPLAVVDSIGSSEAEWEGYQSILYKDSGGGLHSHYRDHTPVWV